MTGKDFMNAVTNGRIDLVQILLDILCQTDTVYCVVGGLAVNAYAEPVVSLDLDLVVVASRVKEISAAAMSRGLKVESFPHSINLSSSQSDLRIQFQTDQRYQCFIQRAQRKEVLGYSMQVAAIEDVLQGKIWACRDEQRRKSKRLKDLADIIRLLEVKPQLENLLPDDVKKKINQ